jgi:hypothetical protein
MDDKHRKRILIVLEISLAVILTFGILLKLYTRDQGVIIWAS